MIKRSALSLRTRATLLSVISLVSAVSPLFLPTQPAAAVETWERLDKRLKSQVLEINVGIKFKLQGSLYCQIADLSPRLRRYVFEAQSLLVTRGTQAFAG